MVFAWPAIFGKTVACEIYHLIVNLLRLWTIISCDRRYLSCSYCIPGAMMCKDIILDNVINVGWEVFLLFYKVIEGKSIGHC